MAGKTQNKEKKILVGSMMGVKEISATTWSSVLYKEWDMIVVDSGYTRQVDPVHVDGSGLREGVREHSVLLYGISGDGFRGRLPVVGL